MSNMEGWEIAFPTSTFDIEYSIFDILYFIFHFSKGISTTNKTGAAASLSFLNVNI
ncbi:hypothetical protein [Niastella populi]|uniref:hypothetical protein n=1 Tax=Niastella populi TaxID=550983 RepID=UPI0013FE4013|nr:hypothetical protein [Niastella populi]